MSGTEDPLAHLPLNTLHDVRASILPGKTLRIGESGMLRIAGLVERLNVHYGHFLNQIDSFAVVDKRHKICTLFEAALSLRRS